MNNYTQYINALRACAKEHKDDMTPFAHIKVSMLCNDVADLLKSLEQESILDKIRAEIEQQKEERCFDDGDMFVYRKGLDDAIYIINKYRAESEE